MLIVGAGKGGRALLEMFVGDPTITIVGVADVNPWAPGLEIARRHDVPVTTDFRELLSARVDLVIDVSGDRAVHRAIHEGAPAGTEVIGGLGARFMWDLAAERKAKEELEGRYALVVEQLAPRAHDAPEPPPAPDPLRHRPGSAPTRDRPVPLLRRRRHRRWTARVAELASPADLFCDGGKTSHATALSRCTPTFRHCALFSRDGGGTRLEVTVSPGEGGR